MTIEEDQAKGLWSRLRVLLGVRDSHHGLSEVDELGIRIPPARLRYEVAGTNDLEWFLEGGRLGLETLVSTLEEEKQSLIVHQGLMPYVASGVVRGQAVALMAIRGRVVFVYRALSEHDGAGAMPVEGTVGRTHHPSALPEVEVAARLGGAGRTAWRLGVRGVGCDGKGQGGE